MVLQTIRTSATINRCSNLHVQASSNTSARKRLRGSVLKARKSQKGTRLRARTKYLFPDEHQSWHFILKDLGSVDDRSRKGETHTSAISISLRPNAARETSTGNTRSDRQSWHKNGHRTCYFEDHVEIFLRRWSMMGEGKWVKPDEKLIAATFYLEKPRALIKELPYKVCGSLSWQESHPRLVTSEPSTGIHLVPPYLTSFNSSLTVSVLYGHGLPWTIRRCDRDSEKEVSTIGNRYDKCSADTFLDN